MNISEIYNDVTNTILSLLEDHQEDWQKPWITLGTDQDSARNPSTQNYYQGVNQILLSLSMAKHDFLNNQWSTFQQIRNMGGTVKKGEKSTPIIFFKTSYIDKDKKYYSPQTIKTMSPNQYAKADIQAIPVIKTYNVFNIAAQTKNLDSELYKYSTSEPLQDFEIHAVTEKFIQLTRAKITEKSTNQAYYNSTKDEIVMPNKNQFRGKISGFYDSLLHELGHWSANSSRLNRPFGKFGDPVYFKEELIAELTSANLGAYLGYSKKITNNVAYIKSWITMLKSDSKAIVSAAASAKKASDYIIACVENNKDKLENNPN